MSTQHGMDTGAQGNDPWAPVPVAEDPWVEVAEADDAWSTDQDGSAWDDATGDTAWTGGSFAPPGDESGSAWTTPQRAPARTRGDWSRRATSADDGRSSVPTTRSDRVVSGAASRTRADRSGTARNRTTDGRAARNRAADGPAADSRVADRDATQSRRAGRAAGSGADDPVSLSDLAAHLRPASSLSPAPGAGSTPVAEERARTEAQERVARMLAARVAETASDAALPGAGEPRTPDTVEPHLADAADPHAPEAVEPLTTRRSARSRRSTRRMPATEPPDAGSAAVDAEPDQESVARAIVLRQLTAAPRSRHQLAEALARRDVPEDVAERVLDRFTEVGLIDDAAYAEMLVRSRHAERGLSRRALTQELRRKGVSPEDFAAALDQVDDADEEEAARALARKKLRATRGLEREVRMRRAYGALGRKGYAGGLVSRVVREELAAEESES
ncbi:RecX family transcriptional regulator [Cellulomonas sp. NPDC089187]|uniref:RecX family transcriptional regulator n=1 Tax=Cellulomonas sp. NPDC089187 TaxID=3154970 RepID=UPI00343D8F91